MLPYSWSLTSGSLPPGLSLDPASGTISGKPTKAGTYNFTAQVADSYSAGVPNPNSPATATANLSLTVVPPPGYWEVASDGGLFAFGAPFFGSMGGHPLNAPVVDMAGDTMTNGYWEVASDGGIFAFGDAQFFGSMGGHPLNQPVVGIAVDPVTGGYWEVASDGGLFSFNAPFLGSMGGQPLNRPVVAMAATGP